jgi:poly-beta-1,6-N-acetyl-D-glucosamine synthase
MSPRSLLIALCICGCVLLSWSLSAPAEPRGDGGSEITVEAALAAPPVSTEAARAGFWGAVGTLLYVYFGYPLIGIVRALLCSRRIRKAAIEPSVTVIVAAHDEGNRIEGRIENLLALDYPRDRLEIVIGSDGSNDDTAERARRFIDRGVKIVAFKKWRGKPAVLNDLVKRSRAEIIVFADARQRFDPSAIRELVAHFADATIGAVSGELVLRDAHASTVGRGAAFYWRYEKFIRRCESRASSTVGATGAIYAIRRTLFEAIPTDTLLDDVLIPLRVVRAGYSVVLEPEAKAYDSTPASARAEYVRKVRTIAGNFQLLSRERWLLNPWANALWFEMMSHKVLRLFLPVLHVVLLVCNVVLLFEGPLFLAAFIAQAGFYAAAAGGHLLRHRPHRPFVLSIPYAICLMCCATVAGFVLFASHRQEVTWDRVATDVPTSAGS